MALVFETGKPIAQVARELGVNDGTLGNWAAKARRDAGEGNGELSETERAELAPRKENTELRCSVMCSSVRWPSGWARRWTVAVVTFIASQREDQPLLENLGCGGHCGELRVAEFRKKDSTTAAALKAAIETAAACGTGAVAGAGCGAVSFGAAAPLCAAAGGVAGAYAGKFVNRVLSSQIDTAADSIDGGLRWTGSKLNTAGDTLGSVGSAIGGWFD